jgi:hypothetical protein
LAEELPVDPAGELPGELSADPEEELGRELPVDPTGELPVRPAREPPVDPFGEVPLIGFDVVGITL